MSDLTTFCYQRRQRMLFTNESSIIRFTPISPYDDGTVTQQQLDMRRKAEILEYNANKSSTKTNNLTRSEKWSRYANGYTEKLCASDKETPTPTSSSDVPGPIIMLYNDPNVQLYNYASGVNSYGIINPPIATGWDTLTPNNVQCESTVDTTISSILIQQGIDSPTYNFTIQTPIAIYLYGTTAGNSTVRIQIRSITPSVLYSENVVQTTPLCSFSSTLDLSLNSPTPTNLTIPYEYSAVVYIGIVTISNIVLPTYPGFVYNFNIDCLLNNTYSNVNLSPTVGVYSNLTVDKLTTDQFGIIQQNLVNCAIVSGAVDPNTLYLSPSKYVTFSISGIPI